MTRPRHAHAAPQGGGSISLRAVAVLVLVATVGVALGFQGWNSRYMDFDHVNYIDAAARFLSDGTAPDRGDVSSYWAFATPGTAWLMVPGMLVFDDPRLFEAIGSATLYAATLLGVFLLARMCFGVRCAYLSVLLYGLSRNGIFNAGSLWSIGHPGFYVWMVYFCLQWVQRRSATYLAAAIVTWFVGMYVDMVLAPAMFVFPAIWLLYRPPVRLAPLAVAAIVVLAVWYPYLRLETTRQFADIRALVLRNRLLTVDYKTSWCEPTLVVRSLTDPSGLSSSEVRRATARVPDAAPTLIQRLAATVRLRYATSREGLTFNFDQMTWSPLAAAPLLALAVVTLALTALQVPARSRFDTDSWNWARWISWIGWTMIVLAPVVNEFVLVRFLSANGTLASATVRDIRILQSILLLTGVAVLLGRTRIAGILRGLIAHERAKSDLSKPDNRLLFALSMVIPWLALLAVVEQGYAVRYFWLFPLQIILVVAAVTHIPEQFGWSRGVALCAQVALTVVLLTHPWIVSPVQAWAKTGWSGPRADDIRAVDSIANDLRARGRTEAAIGYQTFFVGFMSSSNIIDSRYKVGAEYDMVLKHRHGISNSDRCAEGFSPRDEYRIVQKPRLPEASDARPVSWAPLGGEVKAVHLYEYFDVTPHPGYRSLGQFGDYQVLKRIDASAPIDRTDSASTVR